MGVEHRSIFIFCIFLFMHFLGVFAFLNFLGILRVQVGYKASGGGIKGILRGPYGPKKYTFQGKLSVLIMTKLEVAHLI